MKKILFIILILFFPVVIAHKPFYEISNYTLIETPELSHAYYSELNGSEHIYEINSEKDFNLYVNILVPYESNQRDFLVEIYQDNTLINTLNKEKYNWTFFNEPIAGDDYWMGPEYESKSKPGTYKIVVSSSDNTGKYVLATGKIESFTFKDTINTITILPKIKSEFFSKNPLSAYNNKFGFILLSLISILVVLSFIIRNKLFNN